MRDLRVVTVSEDGTRLLLADESGERFSVRVDDHLRAALRGETVREGQLAIALASQLSPRDIQSRVRAGASADEVAEAAGIPLERVLRFAAPVLDERAHMARRGRTVLLRNESMLELGTVDEVATRALTARGAADSMTWDAWRRDDGRWLVACRWLEQHEEHTALWVLDASAGSATPIDDDARALAGMRVSEPARPDDQPAPARLAVVRPPKPSAPSLVPADVTEDETPTGPISPVTDDDTGVLRLTDLADNVTVHEAPVRTPRAVRDTGGRQRPAVPSWDEIMFGRRT
jgi:hypothetical protein